MATFSLQRFPEQSLPTDVRDDGNDSFSGVLAVSLVMFRIRSTVAKMNYLPKTDQIELHCETFLGLSHRYDTFWCICSFQRFNTFRKGRLD